MKVKVCSVDVLVGSLIRATYNKGGEVKGYSARVEAIEPSKSGVDQILRIALLEGGYRSLLVSQIETLETISAE